MSQSFGFEQRRRIARLQFLVVGRAATIPSNECSTKMNDPDLLSPNELRQRYARRLRGRFADRVPRKASLREMADAVMIEAAGRRAPRQR
jgi:hypothetical protein